MQLVNNHHLHIQIYGPEDGHPIILLHHGLGSIRAWRKQIPALVGAGYRVIAYDRWGYGKSEPRPYLEVPSFRDDLTDLEALIAFYELPSLSLLGHSDGGTIALCYAAQKPERVVSLITVAAHIYLEPKMEPGIQNIRRAFEQDQRFRAGMHRAHGEKFEAVFDHWFDGWHRPEALTWNMTSWLSKIKCPTLVIQGQDDEHATEQHAYDIAHHISGSEIWLVPQAGHMLPQDFPDVFNQKLLKFMSVACQKTV